MTINEAIKRAEEVTGRMTIDEAINHAEEVASKMLNERVQCIKCAEEHQQLAEWLKELKQLKEKEPKIGYWITLKDEYDDIVEAVCSYCGKNGNHKWAFCPNCGTKMEGVQE